MHCAMTCSPLLPIRRRFDASQQEMADIVGVDQSTWSRWERGHRHPTLIELQRIRAEARRRGMPWKDDWLFEADEAAA